MSIYSPLSEFLQSPDICYVSVIYDPSETFRYDFHIIPLITIFQLETNHYSLVFLSPGAEHDI